MALSREKQTWVLYPNSPPAHKETELLWVSTYESQKTLQKTTNSSVTFELCPPKKCFRWKRHSNGVTELLWLSCLSWAPLGLDFVTSREAQSQAWIWCWTCRFKFRIHVGITKPGRFLQTYGKGISRRCGTLLLWKWRVKQPWPVPGLCSKRRKVRLGYMQVVKVRLRSAFGLARKMGLFVLLVAHWAE